MNSKLLSVAAAIAFALPLTAGQVVLPIVHMDPPDGVVSGAPGETVGWGFTLDPANEWISFSYSLTLLESNPALGVYTDFIGANGGPTDFAVLPGLDWTQPFSTAGSGLGSFHIDPGAQPGDGDAGLVRVIYDAYTADPATCGGCFLGAFTQDLPFSISVTPAPEPRLGLVAALLAVAMLAARARMNSPARRSRPLVGLIN